MDRRDVLLGTIPVFLSSGCLRFQQQDSSSSEPAATGTESAEPAATGTESAELAQDKETDWPQFGRDAANTGHAPNASGPSEIADSEDGIAGVSESFAIYESQLFVDGSKYQIPISPSSGGSRVANRARHMIVHDESVYTIDSTDQNNGRITRFQMDGTTDWRITLDSTGGVGSFPMGAPTAADGVLYQSTGDGILHAVETSTGDHRWRYDLGNQTENTAAIYDDTVLIQGDQTAALSTGGDELWTNDSQFSSSPTIGDDAVFFLGRSGGPTHGLYALALEDGSQLWSTELSGGAWATGGRNVAYDGERVYVNTEDSISAVDPSDGSIVWETEFDGAGSVTVVSERLYAVGRSSSAGGVVALTKDSGSTLWSEIIDYPILTEPVVSGNTLYVGAGDGLYVYSE